MFFLLYKIYKAPYIIYIKLLYSAVHKKVIGIKSKNINNIPKYA